ncbi:MAG: response regulator [Bdellovibrionaceae bacterium]|nr:response regulator [Bdellovibrio sp.]
MQKNSRKVILIIDDSKDNLELLTTVLESKNYQVHCASNGEEALLMLSELSILPDLILLDAQMPIMDGYQFRAKQKKSNRFKDIPVIIMTGVSDHDLEKNMHEPRGVLVKPLGINTMIESIALCIR